MATKKITKKKIDAATINMQKLIRKDRYQNTYTGFGGSKDVLSRTSFENHDTLTQSEIESMYRYDWIVRKIIDVFPNDGLRQGITLDLGDKELEAKTATVIEDIGIEEKLKEGLSLGRLYGGAILIIGALDGGKPETPLNEDKIKSIKYMTVLDRYQTQPKTYYKDVLTTKYGMPETYELFPLEYQENKKAKNMIVHETRLIRFDGAYLPDRQRISNQYWHDSILNSIQDTLKLFGITLQTGATLMNDFVTKVLKMPNLQSLLAAGNEAALITRIQFALSNMSSLGMTLVGDDEDFSKVQTPVAGLAELINLYVEFVSAASGIPRTRLFGQQLGTLSGADETTRNYYDDVRAYQQATIKRPYKKLISIVLKNNEFTGGNSPDKWSFEFNPLWQQTETEILDNRLKQSQIDSAYILDGVYSADEVRKNRFKADGYSIEMDLDDIDDPNINPDKDLEKEDFED